MTNVRVPVNPCASHGVGSSAKPSWARIPLAAALAGQVALFATRHNRVLAPRDWICNGAVGENGTATMSVADKAGVHGTIKYQNAAATFGDIAELGCPYFTAAARMYRELYGEGCDAPPAGEVVRVLDKHRVKFRDPPGVKGTASNSGGAILVIGAVYFAGGPEATALMISCAIPNDSQHVCAAVVDEFLRWVST